MNPLIYYVTVKLEGGASVITREASATLCIVQNDLVRAVRLLERLVFIGTEYIQVNAMQLPSALVDSSVMNSFAVKLCERRELLGEILFSSADVLYSVMKGKAVCARSSITKGCTAVLSAQLKDSTGRLCQPRFNIKARLRSAYLKPQLAEPEGETKEDSGAAEDGEGCAEGSGASLQPENAVDCWWWAATGFDQLAYWPPPGTKRHALLSKQRQRLLDLSAKLTNDASGCRAHRVFFLPPGTAIVQCGLCLHIGKAVFLNASKNVNHVMCMWSAFKQHWLKEHGGSECSEGDACTVSRVPIALSQVRVNAGDAECEELAVLAGLFQQSLKTSGDEDAVAETARSEVNECAEGNAEICAQEFTKSAEVARQGQAALSAADGDVARAEEATEGSAPHVQVEAQGAPLSPHSSFAIGPQCRLSIPPLDNESPGTDSGPHSPAPVILAETEAVTSLQVKPKRPPSPGKWKGKHLEPLLGPPKSILKSTLPSAEGDAAPERKTLRHAGATNVTVVKVLPVVEQAALFSNKEDKELTTQDRDEVVMILRRYLGGCSYEEFLRFTVWMKGVNWLSLSAASRNWSGSKRAAFKVPAHIMSLKHFGLYFHVLRDFFLQYEATRMHSSALDAQYSQECVALYRSVRMHYVSLARRHGNYSTVIRMLMETWLETKKIRDRKREYLAAGVVEVAKGPVPSRATTRSQTAKMTFEETAEETGELTAEVAAEHNAVRSAFVDSSDEDDDEDDSEEEGGDGGNEDLVETAEDDDNAVDAEGYKEDGEFPQGEPLDSEEEATENDAEEGAEVAAEEWPEGNDEERVEGAAEEAADEDAGNCKEAEDEVDEDESDLVEDGEEPDGEYSERDMRWFAFAPDPKAEQMRWNLRCGEKVAANWTAATRRIMSRANRLLEVLDVQGTGYADASVEPGTAAQLSAEEVRESETSTAHDFDQTIATSAEFTAAQEQEGKSQQRKVTQKQLRARGAACRALGNTVDAMLAAHFKSYLPDMQGVDMKARAEWVCAELLRWNPAANKSVDSIREVLSESRRVEEPYVHKTLEVVRALMQHLAEKSKP